MRSSSSTSYESGSDSSVEVKKRCKRHKQHNLKLHDKTKCKRKRSESSRSSESSSDCEYKKKHRKEKSKKRKSKQKLHKNKRKKMKRLKEKIKNKKDSCNKYVEANPKMQSVEVPSRDTIPEQEMQEKAKAMAPMTKEEWEKQQSIIRRVVDETGRTRLVKGDGEILEEIVSRTRHKEINKQATVGDGNYFQSHIQARL